MAGATAVVRGLAARQTSDSNSETTEIHTGNPALDEFLKLMSEPFSKELAKNSVLAALITSLSVFICLTIAFSLLRPRHRAVYAPKLKHADEKHAPPPVGKGFFSWINPLLKTKEDILVEKVGLDAAVFLRFTKMLRNIFLLISVVGCGIMIPVNVADTVDGFGTGWLQAMTPQLVFGQAFWAHVVCAWLFDIIIAYFLWHNYRKVRRLRRQYFASSDYQRSLHARTLMITDIPQSLRTDEGLMRLTNEVNPTGILPRATIGRNVKVLPKLIEEYEENVRNLESVLAKYLKKPDKLPANRPTMTVPKKYKHESAGGKVDAIDFLTERIKNLEQEIKDTRDRIDKRDAMPYGFVSWEQIEQAHSVAYIARNKHPQGAEIELAPRPSNLIWDNLPIGKHARRTRRLWNNLWVAILTAIWMPINACIAVFLSQLSNLGLVWPSFQRSLEGSPTFWSVVQGIAAPALTSAFYLVLPIIFRRLSMRAGDTTKTSRERHVIHNLYAFFVFNNLIIFSLFSALWTYIAAIVSARKHNSDLLDVIANKEVFTSIMLALCNVSPYWITWLLQRNLGAAIDLVQVIQLFWVGFAKLFMNPTPRQFIEWTAPPPFDYANYYNYFLFYTTIALCFGTLQPLVLPITALYFTLDSWMKKYLLLYVCVTKNESGGQFWRVVYNRVLVGAIISNIIVALVVVAPERGTWLMLAALAPAPFCLLGFKYYCMKQFDDDMRYYTRGGMKDAESLVAGAKRKANHISSKYGHPAMHKPLITPMVNAKARHVLGEIYSGRLSTDAGNAAYADFAMDDMTPQKPGKATNSPFELVSESEMDFANYRDRPEFRDELSGGIYGRPEDLVSERSHTPKSFMGRTGTWETASSRGSSPSPSRGRVPSVPDLRNHPAFRTRETDVGDVGDADSRHGMGSPYDEAQHGLLRNAQSSPRAATPREHYSMEQWRSRDASQTGYGRVQQDVDDEPYDYFRGKR